MLIDNVSNLWVIMRSVFAFASLIAVATLSPAADKKDAGAKADIDAIQGTWSIEAGGPAKGGTITFTRTEVKMQFPKNPDVFTGTFKIDPSKNPKQIDLHLKGGEPNHGIYVLEGDTLKVYAIAKDDGERPTAFPGPKGNIAAVMVLRRKK